MSMEPGSPKFVQAMAAYHEAFTLALDDSTLDDAEKTILLTGILGVLLVNRSEPRELGDNVEACVSNLRTVALALAEKEGTA